MADKINEVRADPAEISARTFLRQAPYDPIIGSLPKTTQAGIEARCIWRQYAVTKIHSSSTCWEEHIVVQDPGNEGFLQFTILRKADLQRIANATRREYRLEDVIHEAWLMAYDLSEAQGAPLNLANDDSQRRLLSHLHQQLVRYTDRKIRNAVRLDHAPANRENSEEAHPLSYLLASNDGRDVVDELITMENHLIKEHTLRSHGSLAAAYVQLLRHFDNNMTAVASHLRISRSHAYRCCAKARWLSVRALHIPIPISEHFLPGPWRSFQLRRPQHQLALDFGDEWLL